MNRRPRASTASSSRSPPRPKRSSSVYSIFRPTTTKTHTMSAAVTTAATTALATTSKSSKEPSPCYTAGAWSPSSPIPVSGRGDEERGGDCRGCGADSDVEVRDGHGRDWGGGSRSRPRSGNPFDFVAGANSSSNSSNNNNSSKNNNSNNINNNSNSSSSNINSNNCPNQHADSITEETAPANDIFASLLQWNSSPPSKNTNNNRALDAKSSAPIAKQSTMPKPSQIHSPAPATTTLRQSLPPRHPKLTTTPASTTTAAATSTTTATSATLAQMTRNQIASSSAFDPFFVVFHPFAQSDPNHVDHDQHDSSSPSPSSLPLPPPPPSSPPLPFPTTNPPPETTPHDQTPPSTAEETHDTPTTHGTTAFHDLANSFLERVEDFATSLPEMGNPCSPFGGYVPEAGGDDAGIGVVVVAGDEPRKDGAGVPMVGAVPPSAVKERTGCQSAVEDGASTTSAASSFLEFVGGVTTSLNPFFSFGEHNDDKMEGGGDDAENDDDDDGVGGAKRIAEGWDVHVGKDVRANMMPEHEFLEASNRSNVRQNPLTVPDRHPPRLPPLACPSSSMQSSRECHFSNSRPLPVLHILPSKYHDEWNAISSYPSHPQQHQMMETSPSFPDLGLDDLDDADHRRNDTGGTDNQCGQLRYPSRSADSDVILHGEVQSHGKNRTRCNTLDNHTILMSSSYYPNDNPHNVNRKRTTTIESVMAVMSLTSTAKSVASPWRDGKSSNGDSRANTAIENDDSGPTERGKGSANVVVVHEGNAEGLEASVAVAHEDGVEWFVEGEEGRATDGAAAFWDPNGRGSNRHVTPIKAIYPIPPLCRTTSDGDYDDASAVSSLSDDERYGFHDDERDGIKAARKKKHYRKHSSSDRGSSELIGSGGAPPSGGGVRAISAFLKKPVELANKMGATGAAIVRQPSTARDTVTTAATTTAHTLETINTPKTPMGEEFLSTWRNMGQNTSNNDSFTSFGHSPGRANSVNSIGSDTFTSQKGYHRRCRYGMNGFDSNQRHSLRNVNTGQQSIGDEVSWFARSPGMPLSPGARPYIPSPGSIMYENALINYKRTPMAPRSYPFTQQPTPMRRPSPSPPVSPRMNSKDFQGIPPPNFFNACENSVVSGTSSTGWTLRSNDRQIKNSGTMSTSSISHGTLGARPMTRSSSISHSFQRPPMATRAKSVQEVFDPFSEMNSQFGNLSTGTPLSNPPRYLKDDPLLSTSRYRGSRLTASPSIRKSKKSIKKSKEKHVIDRESACMIGTIALAETDPLSPLKCGGISQRSFTNTHDCITPQGTFDSLNSPHDASTTPNSHQISPSLKIDEDEEDDATCEFAEEFHRRDKSNVVKDEIKHFIGKFKPKPVVKVGRKLLGRESPSKNLKRADGCLT